MLVVVVLQILTVQQELAVLAAVVLVVLQEPLERQILVAVVVALLVEHQALVDLVWLLFLCLLLNIQAQQQEAQL
jgi:hypothetical protein